MKKQLILKSNGKSLFLFKVTYCNRFSALDTKEFVLLAVSGIAAINRCNKLLDRSFYRLRTIVNVSDKSDNDFIIIPKSIFPID